MANVKNYIEQGGGTVVIGGKLKFESGATLEGFPAVAAAQADSTAETVAALVTDFNSLLSKLRTAGLLAPNAES